MEDYPKSPCIYHPSESITNFCKEKSCLMPLCPTCICTHMDMHIAEGKSNPRFDNINESFNNVTNQIGKFHEKFDVARDQLKNVQKTIENQRKAISDTIFLAKVQIRQMVESTFNDLEKDVLAAVDKQNQAIGLHVPKSLEQMQTGIFEISGKLIEMVKELKTEKGLVTLITFNHQTKGNIERYQNVIFKELKNNQEYSPVANINRAAIDKIKQALTQIVSVKFVVPQDLTSPIKTPTEGCEVGSPSTNKRSSNNINNQGGGSPVYSPKATETKTPFSKTCMNSLRSSFGNAPAKLEIATTNKWTGKTPGTMSPPVGSPVSPINLKKYMDTALFSSLQGKRGVCEMRRVDAQNRY